ncbi:hypothetical protein I6N90_05855 [Paenibacillus sp. GSMTC-2017]|uniref:hypothetical protein n=1 Tax=Paenibacillus sp. GSMTC-2017 TaxID=2794350 RepID=UPI0018D982FB|nr:hypothetical protein [Paenibacillus sp. GSMTC-2017]MBH5317336.1 hypothetical protein [Paenibacillus sp. GSMTC-2017]
MEERQVCQWCVTEIIWDEEIGPESHCPHCENELGGYRSLNVGLENDNDNDDVDVPDTTADNEEWSEEEEERKNDAGWMKDNEGFRSSTINTLATEGVVQRIINEQLELPECPSCREYMLEAGVQTIGGDNFKPTIAPAIGHSVVPNPFNVVMYVCPSCYLTTSILSPADREAMVERLSQGD